MPSQPTVMKAKVAGEDEPLKTSGKVAAMSGLSQTKPESVDPGAKAVAPPTDQTKPFSAEQPKSKPTGPPASSSAISDSAPKPSTAADRLGVIGSVLARGMGAPAEVPKAKAPVPAATSTKYAAAPTTSAAASKDVLGTVTRPPMPAAGGMGAPAVPQAKASTPVPMNTKVTTSPYGTSAYASLPDNMGPAKGYATAAKSEIAAWKTTPKASGPPTEGPAAVAVGRAKLAGRSDAITMKDGKPVAPVVTAKYQIVFVTAELAPYSKTGGLGEAMEGLSIALAGLGHRVMVISPRYDQYKEAWDTSFWSSVDMGGKQEQVHFFHAKKSKVDQVFVDHPCFLERVWGQTGTKLYGPEWGQDFADNQARMAYFCKAATVAIKDLELEGQKYGDDCMVVVNDWHAALVPMFMQAEREANPNLWKTTKTAFLCHNAVYQGRFELEPGLAKVFGVPQKFVDNITFNMAVKIGKKNKKVSCVNTMAAGLKYADKVLSVSPSYALECSTDPEKGVELEGLFKLGSCTGILNGVKEGVSPSNPIFVEKTGLICGPFNASTADAAKAELKAAYRETSGLPASDGPLMTFLGRLDVQKGYDLLMEALADVLTDTDMQVVIVGAGRKDLVEMTKAMAKKFPTKFYYAGWMGPERYALLAGSDYTLLPSRWEPCGLVQMEAMRMGTLPIIAPTGGLKDTVEDDVTGFWADSEMSMEVDLDEQSISSLSRVLRRAATAHTAEPKKITEMRKAAMTAASEFSWTNSALQYEMVFSEMGATNVLPASETYVTLEADKQIC